MVPDAIRAQVARGAAVVALGAALSGCFGDASGQQPPSEAGAALGVPVRLADCSDWRRSAVRERYQTVRQIRTFAGGPVGTGGGHGATLPDDAAYDLFQHYCGNNFAVHFKLYKLYTRAASFRAR